MTDLTTQAGERIRPLTFIPGCNTPQEVSRAQVEINVARDLPWLTVHSERKPPFNILVIVAGGPSLKDRWRELEEWSGSADIMALNNAYAFLIERDIRVDHFMLMDARAENVGFVRNPRNSVKHWLSAQCHPDVFDALAAFDVTLYLPTLPGVLELVKGHNKPKVQLAGTAGTVGIKALALAYALGYRDLHLYGYDSSYQDDEHHAFPQALNDQSNTIDVYLGDRRYVTTAAFAHQAAEFPGFAQTVLSSGCSLELHCSGLLPDFVAMANTIGEIPLEQREREKYEQIWSYDKYRRASPGERMVEDAIASLGMTPGESVNDYGCGSGRACAKFIDKGYQVAAIDHAENCLDAGVVVQAFVQACLWDLPEAIDSDWAYCTDVMEHIPNEKVEAVIAGIAARTRKGAYFNIATRDDNFGALIGRKLHMTVMTAEGWWRELKKFWPHMQMRQREGEATFICRSAP